MTTLEGSRTVMVLLLATVTAAAAEPVKQGAAIFFADERSKERFEAYRAFLERDPARYAGELATIGRLERSDAQFVFAIVGALGGDAEGTITTDGERVILSVSDVGGALAENASMMARIAHELEHARQFDAGELALACDPKTGRWASHYGSYDIGDEVKAWRAQLDVAGATDYWSHRRGTWTPTLLRLFANERNDAGRARVLAQHGYASVNPVFESNLRFDAATGYAVGQLVRPDLSRGANVFGRVWALDGRPPTADVAAPIESVAKSSDVRPEP